MAKKAIKSKRTGARPDFDNIEIESQVCQLLCAGKGVSEIVEILGSANVPISLTRQQPYKFLQVAAERGRLRYQPLVSFELSHRLKSHFEWLTKLDVVHATTSEAIAERAAENLLGLICGKRKSKRPDEYHLGFAGGGLLQMTARRLAEKIARTSMPLPKRIVFHAMVGRFGENPATDPNSFVGYFTSEPLPIEIRFVGLMAPGLVSSKTMRQLRTMEGTCEAFKRANEIDVIVTSAGGHWKKGCSQLFGQYQERRDHAALNALKDANCIGDLMWRPLGAKGPIELETGIRATTLVELSQLPDLIAKQTSVMLVLGPCVTCGEPKLEMMNAILHLEPHLITDLVCDSLTARVFATAFLAKA